MIATAQYHQALRALQRLIVHAKSEACEAGADRVHELLNDVELLPEFIADEADRTGEFVELLQGIALMHPNCRYIVEEFERVLTGSSDSRSAVS